MKTTIRPRLCLVIGLGASILAASAFGAPLADRLERPAHLSTNTGHRLLTDVQRVGERLVAVGESGHILLREPDGRLQQSSVPVDLLLTAVHFVGERDGWAVGHDGVVLHSADGGRTWSKQLDGRAISQLMVSWAEAEVARLEAASAAAPGDAALESALDNANFALDDARAGAEAGSSRPLLDVWFRDAQEGWAVGAYGMIVHTRDGGKTWAFVPGLENPDRLHLNAVLGLAAGNLLVAGEGGHLYRTNDAGRHWQRIQPSTPASLYKLMQLRDGRVLALGFGGTLLSSQDQGDSWQQVPLPVRAGLYGGVELDDGSLLLAGQGGVLLASRDGQRFRPWSSANKAALLGVAAIDPTQLALVGGRGLQVLPMTEIREQLQ
ncbi:WD40/YVTN/BNR-like repeat-containing protein [Pseudomonas sp. GCM10022186]|uniref:WD40/YVTN/BNR-like repeat-containing protein n=1 Tax=Pseudomonas sp. GCM10022186 TaxID=3252650 RepID=UPI003616DE05